LRIIFPVNFTASNQSILMHAAIKDNNNSTGLRYVKWKRFTKNGMYITTNKAKIANTETISNALLADEII